jgi:hypothetical protein
LVYFYFISSLVIFSYFLLLSFPSSSTFSLQCPYLLDSQHWLNNLLYIFYMKPHPSFPSAIGDNRTPYPYNNWTTPSHTIACMWSTFISYSCHTTHLFYKKQYEIMKTAKYMKEAFKKHMESDRKKDQTKILEIKSPLQLLKL